MKLEIDLDFENIEDGDGDDSVISAVIELIDDIEEDIRYRVTEFLVERNKRLRSLVNFCNTGEFL